MADERGPESLRLVLVDDHEFAREAVAQSLEAEAGIQVVGQDGTVAHARSEIERLKPDVAVIDFNLPDGTGQDLVEHLTATSPEIRCVVYTSLVDETEARSLIQAGASAVVLKTLRGTDLIDAICDGSNLSPSRSTTPSFEPWGEG